MPLDDAVADLLAPGGLVAGALDRYENRTGQIAMARRVARAFDDDERLLVEAGTGTGKTLAYLVPAILSGRKVVISTGTRTLQDQLARIDLPRLQAVLPQKFSFTVCKGLSNYICLRRFEEHARQLELAATSTGEIAHIRAFIEKSGSGDKADLVDLADDAPVWREVTATPETRLGARCVYYERCFVTGMRRRALEAQIILTNHHLFFADLALRSRWPEAQVLPPYEAVIFDEAHQLEEVATEFFGLHVSSQRLFALARDVAKARVPPAAMLQVATLARRLFGATDALANALRSRLGAGSLAPSDEMRVPAPNDLWTSGSALLRYHELDTALEEATSLFDRLSGDDLTSWDRPIAPSAGTAAALGGLERRAHALRTELGEMIDPGRRDQAPTVRWLAASARNVSLRSSPVDIAPLLSQRFDAHAGPLVFTSATLTAGGTFSYMRDRLGLGDTAAEAIFPSPFRYAHQALLYLATDLPDPTDDSFATKAAERAVELCRMSRGRALLLFTSFRNLRVAEEYLRADGGFPLLVQGTKPRHVLLQSLRDNLGSVLLASQSFWEGVDVPGEALSLVAIDRLPFQVPDDPLTAARLQRIRDENGDPFASYQLPRAALALKQGFGRLVRTARDRGVVAILDGRIVRKSYGSTLLESLPRECPRTEDLRDVTTFFDRFAKPGDA